MFASYVLHTTIACFRCHLLSRAYEGLQGQRRLSDVETQELGDQVTGVANGQQKTVILGGAAWISRNILRIESINLSLISFRILKDGDAWCI